MSNSQHNKPRLKLAAPPTEEDKRRAREELERCPHCKVSADDAITHGHAPNCPSYVPDAAETILNDVAAFLERFVVFQSPAQRDAVGLWVAHTHFLESCSTTPRLS